jgi:hypothetical protein
MITPKNYRSLKASYDVAVARREPEFIWRENVMLTNLAKYILIHMRNELGIKEDNDNA